MNPHETTHSFLHEDGHLSRKMAAWALFPVTVMTAKTMAPFFDLKAALPGGRS